MNKFNIWVDRFLKKMKNLSLKNKPTNFILKTSGRFAKIILTTILTTIAILIIILGIILFIFIKNQDKIVDFVIGYLSAPTTITKTVDEEGKEEVVVERTTIFTEEQFVIDVVEKSNKAVVSVILTKEVPTFEAYYDPNSTPSVPGFEFFSDFFVVPEYRQNGTETREVGGGSGFLASSDGYIVTNKHVVNQTDVDYTVFLNDGRKFNAEVIAKDEILDVAILKITGTTFPYLNFGDSDDIKVGQSAIAIGNALSEFKNTVSVGVISGLSRSVLASDNRGGYEQLDKVIQTDAAINPGNSGGPLLNLRGEVVGVNVAVVRGSENIGFALPINIIKPIVESVRATGKIERPFLGIRYIQVTKELQEQNNLPIDYGVVIVKGSEESEPAVIPGSPADKAGLRENDVILSIDGVNITEDRGFSSIIREKNIGDSLRLRVWRKGLELTLYAILETAEE